MRRAWTTAIVMMVLMGCYASPRGGVSPAPPGPVDALNIIFRNDYSRLCPDRYEYCRAGKHSICCPTGGCCHDGTAPYCCDGQNYAREDSGDREDRYERGPGDRGPCGPRSTTCSRAGITVCCAESEGCCSDERGLYCCSGRDDRY